MNRTFADLTLMKKITCGAVNITETPAGFEFFRLSSQQIKIYEQKHFASGNRFLATSGIRFEFITDAESFFIAGKLTPGSSRKFAFFDVVINGVLVQHEGTDDYYAEPDFKMTVALDGSKNKVAVYLPNLSTFQLTEMYFTNATSIDSVSKKGTIICWGDSITQGYDAIHPSLSYANLIADALDMELINKAIGGEVFAPEIIDGYVHEKPDIITVAYGTNDWSSQKKSDIIDNCNAFFERMVNFYPGIPVYAIMPLWRKDQDKQTAAGEFSDVHEIIRNACKKHSNITLIDGRQIAPHIDTFFYDSILHPNDLGFCIMAQNLLKYIKQP